MRVADPAFDEDYEICAWEGRYAWAKFDSFGREVRDRAKHSSHGAIRRRGGDERAHQYAHRALELYRRVRDRLGGAITPGDLGLIHERQGHHDRARDHHGHAPPPYRPGAVTDRNGRRTGCRSR
ncbi:hypothetical protein GCM10010517_29470 [Streptosporangium fragile]|uniref:Uncharacterized protein n=1 Tax=Streptosporangium fragile TaxID=46186 RepID=A0ABN3VXL1_9ACTN